MWRHRRPLARVQLRVEGRAAECEWQGRPKNLKGLKRHREEQWQVMGTALQQRSQAQAREVMAAGTGTAQPQQPSCDQSLGLRLSRKYQLIVQMIAQSRQRRQSIRHCLQQIAARAQHCRH